MDETSSAMRRPGSTFDSDGSATFSLPRSEAKTGDNVTASFAGDDIYLPAQAQQTVSKN